MSGSYGNMSGTSMASPHVAGVAALVLKGNAGFTNVEVRNAMNSTAIDLGDPGRDNWYGYGLVYAPDAVAGGGDPPPPDPDPPPPGDALVVTVWTDKDAYTGWLVTVYSDTTVKDEYGAAVSGASVQTNIYDPWTGDVYLSYSGTTNSSGVFYHDFWLWMYDPWGTYTIVSTANKTGYDQGVGQKQFTYWP